MIELAVVIATLNRPAAVLAVLSDVVLQAPRGSEILVVDQSEPQAFRRLAQGIETLADPRIRHILLDKPGLIGARNYGIERTTAPIVLFLDDDVRLAQGCIAGHIRALHDPTVGGVVGRIEERVALPNSLRTENRLDLGGRIRTNLTGDRSQPIQTLKGANMCFRRIALEQAGPFDSAYAGTALLEDADMSTRVAQCGWSLRFEPSAAVEHLSLPSGGVRVGSALSTERWRFHNTAYFMRRHRSKLSLVPMVATFSAIAIKRAVAWREPTAVARLMVALARGWRLGSG